MYRFIGDIGNGALLLALSICLAAVGLTYGVSFFYEKLKKSPTTRKMFEHGDNKAG